tara:strand:- start:1009 stop:1515 length:507 start_codon:yes stop_codon:yes gene_type:complete
MATIIKNASLTSSITDSVVLNGVTYGNNNRKSISACNEAIQQVVTVPASSASQGSVPLFGANAAPNSAGDVTFDKFKYARVTNLDDTNSVFVSVSDIDGVGGSTATAYFTVEVPAGMSFVIPSLNFDCATSALDGKSLTHSTAYNTKARIDVVAITADVDVEFIVVTL